jgi:hypothetical protein
VLPHVCEPAAAVTGIATGPFSADGG